MNNKKLEMEIKQIKYVYITLAITMLIIFLFFIIADSVNWKSQLRFNDIVKEIGFNIECYEEEIKQYFNSKWIDNCCEKIDKNETEHLTTIDNNTFKIGFIRQPFLNPIMCFEVEDVSFSKINDVNVSLCLETPQFINITTCKKEILVRDVK